MICKGEWYRTISTEKKIFVLLLKFNQIFYFYSNYLVQILLKIVFKKKFLEFI